MCHNTTQPYVEQIYNHSYNILSASRFHFQIDFYSSFRNLVLDTIEFFSCSLLNEIINCHFISILYYVYPLGKPIQFIPFRFHCTVTIRRPSLSDIFFQPPKTCLILS